MRGDNNNNMRQWARCAFVEKDRNLREETRLLVYHSAECGALPSGIRGRGRDLAASCKEMPDPGTTPPAP